MPELPDVEVFRKYLNRTSLNQDITGVDFRNRTVLEGVSRGKIMRELTGNSFTETRRHGKNLFVKYNGRWPRLNFGMTGYLKYFKNMEDDPDHDRMLISFDNGYRLAYVNQRLFGAIGLVGSVGVFIREKGLGPDADGISLEEFSDILKGGCNLR